ncbi:uncharacterized protein LOC126331994 [Schistocerca gregaria]|uniref:uncharacterized protein LOC126331994 n=1 Tax=Schistocerca gregaria TaxID=7010 RepID=UPI00211EDE21|nr:uncharacterized protein LOC126331994 [Schistocerca gregaria]
MRLALLCVAALGLLSASSADRSDEWGAASAEPTEQPCPDTCPSVHRAVCAESHWPRDTIWFSNPCFKRMCECRLGKSLTVREKSVCRQRDAQWDLCPMYPPVIPPRSLSWKHKLLERQENSDEAYSSE